MILFLKSLMIFLLALVGALCLAEYMVRWQEDLTLRRYRKELEQLEKQNKPKIDEVA